MARPIPLATVHSRTHQQRMEALGRYADGVRDADMRQLSLGADLVDGRGADTEPRRHLAHREQPLEWNCECAPGL